MSRASNRRLQAGLLWKLLPKLARLSVSKYLGLEDMQTLNQSYMEYRELSVRERRALEIALLRATSRNQNVLPLLFFGILSVLSLGLFLIFQAFSHTKSDIAGVFAPLFLATLGPLALYMIPKYKLSNLFGFPNMGSLVFAFFASLGLLWTLLFINSNDPAIGQRPDRITLLILAFGASLAPILEEICFREIIPSWFGREPHYIGHLISAILFSVSHLPRDPMGFGLYAIAGAFLSGVRLQSGGLILPIVVHGLANLGALFLF